VRKSPLQPSQSKDFIEYPGFHLPDKLLSVLNAKPSLMYCFTFLIDQGIRQIVELKSNSVDHGHKFFISVEFLFIDVGSTENSVMMVNEFIESYYSRCEKNHCMFWR
jgi:hypothetical protein